MHRLLERDGHLKPPQSVEELAESLLAPFSCTLEELEEGMLQRGWVKLKGVVRKLLPDLVGRGKHQLFVLSLNSKSGQQNIEVDHSLDAAPRAPVKPGDEIQVKGLYEPQGHDGKPVVHFTHRSRDGSQAGFIFSPEGRWTVQ